MTENPVVEADVTAAALQYVRKISGYRKPSRRNQAAFDLAVSEVAATTQKLLENLEDSSPASKKSIPVNLILPEWKGKQ